MATGQLWGPFRPSIPPVIPTPRLGFCPPLTQGLAGTKVGHSCGPEKFCCYGTVLCLSGQSPHGHGGLGDSAHLIGEETEGHTPGLGHRDSRRAGYFYEDILCCLAPGTWWRARILAAMAPEECLSSRRGALVRSGHLQMFLGTLGLQPRPGCLYQGTWRRLALLSLGSGRLSVSYTSSHEVLRG